MTDLNMLNSMRSLILTTAVLTICVQTPGPVLAQAGPLRRVMQTLARKFGAELAEEGTELTSKRLARVLARHGDDLAPVLENLGPRAVRLADELPEGAVAILRRHGRAGLAVLQQHGEEAVALFSRHGDEAVKLLAAHPGVGPRLARTLGSEAVPALSRLSRPEAVRLAKMADDIDRLLPEARTTFVQRLAQGGDDFVAWVWRRKKEIFGTAALAGAVLSTYKFGDGLATAVPQMIPRAAPSPDPISHPWLAFFDRWMPLAMVVLSLTFLGALRLIQRRSTRAAECNRGHARSEQARLQTNHTPDARQP
jgi:hypothetical protein